MIYIDNRLGFEGVPYSLPKLNDVIRDVSFVLATGHLCLAWVYVIQHFTFRQVLSVVVWCYYMYLCHYYIMYCYITIHTITYYYRLLHIITYYYIDVITIVIILPLYQYYITLCLSILSSL